MSSHQYTNHKHWHPFIEEMHGTMHKRITHLHAEPEQKKKTNLQLLFHTPLLWICCYLKEAAALWAGEKNQIDAHTACSMYCKTTQEITQTQKPLRFLFLLFLCSYWGEFSNLPFNVPLLSFAENIISRKHTHTNEKEMSPSPQAMIDSIKSNSATGATFQGKFVSALLTFKKSKRSLSRLFQVCVWAAASFVFSTSFWPDDFYLKSAEAELLGATVQRFWGASEVQAATGLWAQQSVAGTRWACRTAASEAQSAHYVVLHSGRVFPAVHTLL